MRRGIGLFLGLFLFILILAMPTAEGMLPQGKRVAACAVLMATWWITEAIPIWVTALFPLVLYPFLRIMNAQEVALPYANKNVFLFMGGFFIAMAMQKWELHRRIALHIIRIVGTSLNRMVLGFMVATAFLSMWISNTATTMMMLPIAMAVLIYVREVTKEEMKIGARREFTFGTTLLLGIAYSASIGGIGTLVGTPPNIVFAGAVKSLFPQAPEIGFLQWMLVGLPLVCVFLPITWLYLTRVVSPIRLKRLPAGKEVIAEQVRSLGAMKKGEKWVLAIFSLTAFGWIFRRNIDIGVFVLPGWSDLLGIEKYVHDSTVAMFGAILLMVIPVNLKKREFVLDWEWAKRIPWGIILLFGGGFALAKGFQQTGLAGWIGGSLKGLSGMPVLVMIALVCLLLTFLTELTSNTATTTIMMPVLAATALAMGSHPFLLMVPATISASCAFMLPVATPPNAIVFGSGHLSIPKMAKAGIGLNFIGVILVTTLIYLIAIPLFGIVTGGSPSWATISP